MNNLIRMRSIGGNLVIEEHQVLSTSRTGRYTTSPGISAEGVKPERLGQFNNLNSKEFVIIDTEDKMFRNINFFMRKYRKVTKNRIKDIVTDIFFRGELATHAEI